MQSGKVKFFNESKGFGFIKDNDSDKEYFVHVTGLIDKVRENDDVTFDVTEGRKGLNAVNVKLAQFLQTKSSSKKREPYNNCEALFLWNQYLKKIDAGRMGSD